MISTTIKILYNIKARRQLKSYLEDTRTNKNSSSAKCSNDFILVDMYDSYYCKDTVQHTLAIAHAIVTKGLFRFYFYLVIRDETKFKLRTMLKMVMPNRKL